MRSRILLIDPKFPHNVGSAIRAASIFGSDVVRWTGDRVPEPRRESGERIPREERMKLYSNVYFAPSIESGCIDTHVGFTPVCVELNETSEQLPDFEHPEDALYVFGPEDGNVPKGIRTCCHRFVHIPSLSCLNLAAAVNVVLYDRCVKVGFPSPRELVLA